MDLRIDYWQCNEAKASLIYVAPNVSYPVYFGRKEEPTDERGVFDVARAESLCKGVGPGRDS